EGEPRVLDPEVGDLAELVGELCALEPADRLELLVGGARRADEVRLVGVREPVRVRPGGGEDGVLVEAERRLAGSGEGEDVGDRPAALRVRARVRAPLAPAKPDAPERRHVGHEPRPVAPARAHLEVRSARTGERAAAEEHTPEVRAATARAADD